jgi:hypothetical protein
MSVTINGTNGFTFNDNSTQTTAATGFGFKNRIINGDMRIDQRNSGASTAVADDVYCFDRWYVLTQTASVNVSQQTNQQDGIPFNIRLTQNQSSAQRMGLAQIIESSNCRDLRGGAVTLNFQVRVSGSQAVRYAILEWTGTADSVTSDVVNSWTNSTYTEGQFFISTTTTVTAVGSITPSANTWTTLSVPLTGTLGSSFNNITVFVWTEGTAAQNFTLDISNVQLEKGSTATSFDYRPQGTMLALCQRYYLQQAVSVGTSYNGNGGNVGQGSYIAFKVKMRGSPTISFTNISASNTNTDNTHFITADGFFYQVNILATGNFSRQSTAAMASEL